LEVSKGVPFDGKLLEQVNSQLSQVCRFTDCISVTSSLLYHLGYDVEVKGDKLTVKSCSLVKEVEFKGLPEQLKEVEKTVELLLKGKRLTSESLNNVKQLLLLKLRSSGYREATVHFERLGFPDCYTLLVKVVPGPLFYVKGIEILSPKKFRPFLLKSFSPLKGSPLDLNRLKSTLEKVEKFFLERGFYNVSVNYSFRFQVKGILSKDKRPVILSVSVKPGKRYVLKFVGNRHFSDKELFPLLTFKTARSVDEFELENSRKNIEKFYRDRGFPYVKVSVEVKERKGLATVIFNISEGKKVILKELSLPDGLRLPEEFAGIVGTPFSEEKIKRLVLYLKRKFLEDGYRDVMVSYVLSDGSLKFRVEKGKRYVVTAVKVTGDSEACFKELELTLPFPFSPTKVGELRSKLVGCYAKKGYPDVSVDISETSEDVNGKKALTLNVAVSPGELYRFGFVIVLGLERTKLKWIENLFTLSPGQVYSKEKVVAQYSRLVQSRLFSSVTVEDFKVDGCINEVVKLKEGNRLHLRGFVGLGTDSGYILNGFLSSTSPLGLGVRYFLFGNFRQKEGYDAVFKLNKPAFPFRKYETSYSVIKKEQIFQSFITDRVLYRFSLSRRASRAFSQSFGMEIAREKVRDTSINTERRFVKRTLFYIQNYDRRDSITNPSKGYLSRFKLSFSGSFLGGDTDYYQGDFKFLYLFSPFEDFTLAFRWGIGLIQPVKGSSVPVQDRFYLGGAESVRGYKYGTISPTDDKGNFVGGKAYGLLSFELRYLLRDNVQLAFFCDSGNVFKEFKDFDFRLSDWYSSVGFGFRYLTPVGPLRFDYGYKLKKVPHQGPGRIHISFGFPF